jgi:hypothetical protein
MSDFKTQFIARINELADKYKHLSTKYYIIKTFNDSNANQINNCIFSATNKYELWLKVHHHILSKNKPNLKNGFYGDEEYYIESGMDKLEHSYPEEYDYYLDKIYPDGCDYHSDIDMSKIDMSKIDMSALVKSSVNIAMHEFEHGDTEWFEKYTELI